MVTQTMAEYPCPFGVVRRRRTRSGAVQDMTQRLDSEKELVTCDAKGRLMMWDCDYRDPVQVTERAGDASAECFSPHLASLYVSCPPTSSKPRQVCRGRFPSSRESGVRVARRARVTAVGRLGPLPKSAQHPPSSSTHPMPSQKQQCSQSARSVSREWVVEQTGTFQDPGRPKISSTVVPRLDGWLSSEDHVSLRDGALAQTSYTRLPFYLRRKATSKG